MYICLPSSVFKHSFAFFFMNYVQLMYMHSVYLLKLSFFFMRDTGLNIVAAMAVNIFARCHASPFQCV